MSLTLPPELVEIVGEEAASVLVEMPPEVIAEFVEDLPEHVVDALLAVVPVPVEQLPQSPAELAAALDDSFRLRSHLSYLSERIAEAVRAVEAGQNRRLIIELPPRSGKTTLCTIFAAAWMLQRHPDWPIALTSHDGQLATSWGRRIRRWAETGELGGQVSVAKDAGAASSWETTKGGKLLSISVRESFTGRGAKVLIIDDPHKDFMEVHSSKVRDNLWDWWLSVAQTRLEPPSLVIVTMTRWHEDDLVGRLLSKEREGSPADWEVIRLPAVAEDADALGRAAGDPLISPLMEETPDAALIRWEDVKAAVGSYVWSAMYQQRPAPAKGAIFDMDKFRYWTLNPDLVTDDGRVVLLTPEQLASGRWLDSWDAAFGATDTTKATRANLDYVVGQRWVRVGANRILIAQQRGRFTFPQTIERMRDWAKTAPEDHAISPYGHLVHERAIEAKANGPAIIQTLRDEIAGLKPITPKASKESRARNVTPEIESGNVLLPLPTEEGNEWVVDLLSELRNFPRDAHDDQVDGLTQALAVLRTSGGGRISVPGQNAGAGASVPQNRAAAARSGRPGLGGRGAPAAAVSIPGRGAGPGAVRR